MKLDTFNINVWQKVNKHDRLSDGYFGTFIKADKEENCNILIFRDENDKKHFVIETKNLNEHEIQNININGLKLSARRYKFNGNDVKEFLDIECTIDDYLQQFTKIIKEIAASILILNNDPIASALNIIQNWKSFFSSQIKTLLSEEEQIGLICELLILRKLCNINPTLALNSWKGPLKEKHDFMFTDWTWEVKGTRSSGHIHHINGIDQLKKSNKKSLAFISFILTQSHSFEAISLEFLITDIVSGVLKNKPVLIELFYTLLISAGYSKVFSEEYTRSCYDIIESVLFIVDENFPKLTSENLIDSLNKRISEIKYKIDLQGLSNESLDVIHFGNYFY